MTRDRDDDFLNQPAAPETERLLVDEGVAPTPRATAAGSEQPALRRGQVIGGRYQPLELVGRGGMSEVWRTFDLKLRAEVALKVLLPGLLKDAANEELIRSEVRAARQVVSPNVCRVFDLAAEGGVELVSMEYVEGQNLAALLAERGPLEPAEASRIASQFLAGLEAIHRAGLVHRDLKPENLMVTPTGRVVVMDFGIAHSLSERAGGGISGTPAYMSPEQARGLPLDVRADVFAAGVILAEMLLVHGSDRTEARRRLWKDLHRDPPSVPPGPWAEVIRRAVARAPEERYPTAGALARALEDVTLRSSRARERSPYPGLAPFSVDDADVFFGRELEVERLLRQLERPRLRAVVGPSGAGKSSFLRAGLLPALPPSWSAVTCTPGTRPFLALARALESDPAGSGNAEDAAAVIDLARRWRGRHEQALVIVDQFEELFTLHPEPVQARFAELLLGLVLEADVHVLLAVRDDFLFRCQLHEPLRSVFSAVTPLGPPAGPALRCALVQPALYAGYRFEDERLVDDMLAQVAAERGALPLLAFAASRLWELRDRERGLLTRAAYEEIGGVGGALAQHAEATLHRIGAVRLPVVRELFRHLVTAEGTRVIHDRDELLSVLGEGDAAAAEEVLQGLIEARLLTSFEALAEEDGGVGHRVEIIHESLLAAWPRLMRWRAEDAEGARVHDQLRQAARLWDERGRPEDLLWTGASYEEFRLWRGRYPGRLTTIEEAFARSMGENAGRRRRRRRLAAGTLIALLAGVSLVVTGLWRQAVSEGRRAEAQQTFALGQIELAGNPTAALAYATASLEQADTPHARRLALRALWHGPIAFALGTTDHEAPGSQLAFSPDGRWLGAVEEGSGTVRLWGSDGSGPRVVANPGGLPRMGFSDDSRFLVITQAEEARIYSLPELELKRRIEGSFRWGLVRGQDLITCHVLDPAADGSWRRLHKRWRLPDGEPDTLGVVTMAAGGYSDLDPAGRHIHWNEGGDLYEFSLGEIDAAPRRVVHLDEPLYTWLAAPDGERLYAWGSSGAGGIWSRATGSRLPGPSLARPDETAWWLPAASLDGRWLAAASGEGAAAYLWDLQGPMGAQPLALRRDARVLVTAFDPTGTWLAVRDNRALTLWPLATRQPYVLTAGGGSLWSVAVGTEGRWVAAGGEGDSRVWLWPVAAGAGAERSTLDAGGAVFTLEASPRGDLLAAGTLSGVWLVPLDGRPPERLPGFEGIVLDVAFDAEGRRLAAGGVGVPLPADRVVRIWDLETRATRLLDSGDAKPITSVAFLADDRLLTAGGGGLRSWDLASGHSALLHEGVALARPGPDGRRLLGLRATPGPQGLLGTALIYDLEAGAVQSLDAHGDQVTSAAWDPAGRFIVTGSRDGIVRVGPATDEEPHLLFGHQRGVRSVAVDPGGSWIVSAAEDGTVRLWPVPADARPLHTLPHDELLERLRSLTNFRVTRDPASPGGYRLEFEPVQGWDRLPPTW